MPAYLTADEATQRLQDRYGITSEVYDADLEAASDEVDQFAPFAGVKAGDDQEREFPRRDATTGAALEVPAAVLNYVALRAAELGADEDDEEPAITRESILDRSVTYAEPKMSRHQKRLQTALAGVQGYMRATGSRA